MPFERHMERLNRSLMMGKNGDIVAINSEAKNVHDLNNFKILNFLKEFVMVPIKILEFMFYGFYTFYTISTGKVNAFG